MLPLLLIYSCVLLLFCSSDDDVVFIKVDFQIQNTAGIECYDFKEGDNVIFDLTDQGTVL